MKLIDSQVNFVTTHYRATLALILTITAIMSYYYISQEQDNHIGVFFKKDAPIYLRYQQFIEDYGNEEFVLIVFKEKDLFTIEMVRLIRGLTRTIEEIKGVERVISLTEVEEMIGEDDVIHLKKIIPEGELSGHELKLAEMRARANRAIRDNLLSEDGTTTAIYVEIESLSEAEKLGALNEIRRMSQMVAGNRVRLYYAGVPFIESELNNISKRDARIFTPVIFSLIFIIIILLFRNLTITVLAMMTLYMAQIWGVGLYVLCGERFNTVTSVMGAILIAMAVADSIHLLSQFQDNFQGDGKDFSKIVAKATKMIWIPCLLTTLTTCAGFFSFVVSTSRPAVIIGIFTAIGIVFALVIDVTFLPAALVVMRKRITRGTWKKNRQRGGDKPHEKGPFTRALVGIGNFSTGNSFLLATIFIIIVCLSIIGISKIKFETNSTNYLPESNERRSDMMFHEKNLGGSVPVILLVKSKTDLDFTHPEAVKLVETIQRDISRHDMKFITNAYSIADYAKEFNKAFNNNDDRFYTIPERQSDILDFYEIGDSEQLDRLISIDRREVCIPFVSVWVTNEAAVSSFAYYQDYLKKKLGNSFDFVFTGLSTLYLEMEEMLEISMIRSFLVAFSLIFLMMLFVCKNFKLAILSMIPNTFPIIMTLGIMGWFEIRLDVATIMIASVTLGIAVDDTIHFLTWYRRNTARDPDRRAAIVKTFETVGKPIVITTIVLFIGFGVLVLGSFLPTQKFGVLTGFSMLLALIGDLFFLPALIMIFKPKVTPLV